MSTHHCIGNPCYICHPELAPRQPIQPNPFAMRPGDAVGTTDNSGLHYRITTLERELAAANDKLHELRGGYEQATKGMHDLNAILSERTAALNRTADERDAARSEVAELSRQCAALTAERDRLIRTFRHYHVAANNGTDFCKKCGLDLREQVHASPDAPMNNESAG